MLMVPKDFLLLDEKAKENEPSNEPSNEQLPTTSCLISCRNVTVKWPKASKSDENTLTSVSFTLQHGQCLAIVGQVGSGKVVTAYRL